MIAHGKIVSLTWYTDINLHKIYVFKYLEGVLHAVYNVLKFSFWLYSNAPTKTMRRKYCIIV